MNSTRAFISRVSVRLSRARARERAQRVARGRWAMMLDDPKVTRGRRRDEGDDARVDAAMR